MKNVLFFVAASLLVPALQAQEAVHSSNTSLMSPAAQQRGTIVFKDGIPQDEIPLYQVEYPSGWETGSSAPIHNATKVKVPAQKASYRVKKTQAKSSVSHRVHSASTRPTAAKRNGIVHKTSSSSKSFPGYSPTMITVQQVPVFYGTNSTCFSGG